MVYDYLITLQKQDNKLVDHVSQLMYVFALGLFGFFYYNYPKSGVVYLFFAAGIILCWVYALIKRRKKGKTFFRYGLLIAAAGFLVGPESNIWMAILYAVSGLLERQVKFPKEIGFSSEQISFNSFPSRAVLWSEVKNALIKDGMLTIDFKNNKLYQKEIEGYVTAGIENEFNAFCRRCIAGAKSNP